MPTQNGTSPRGTAFVTAVTRLTDHGSTRPKKSSGPKTTMPASSALSSTGISSTMPRRRSGARSATSRLTLAPSDVPPTTALSTPEVVEQPDDLPGEGGHRVALRIVRPVAAAVPEQVERDHPVARRGDAAGQRLVHAPGHQLHVEQDEQAARRSRTRCTPAARPRRRTARCARTPGLVRPDQTKRMRLPTWDKPPSWTRDPPGGTAPDGSRVGPRRRPPPSGNRRPFDCAVTRRTSVSGATTDNRMSYAWDSWDARRR